MRRAPAASTLRVLLTIACVAGIGLVSLAGADAGDQASLRDTQPASPALTQADKAANAAASQQGFDIDKYFAAMEDSVSVYDPASPWIYDKTQWRKRVEQMFKIRQFLDLNSFHRTETELGDMRVVTVYRELRRVEGSLTSRLHGRITWVYLKRPDGQWNLWHDHTSEIPEGFTYEQ
jgi:ketosteroid isomerase-like protein